MDISELVGSTLRWVHRGLYCRMLRNSVLKCMFLFWVKSIFGPYTCHGCLICTLKHQNQTKHIRELLKPFKIQPYAHLIPISGHVDPVSGHVDPGFGHISLLSSLSRPFTLHSFFPMSLSSSEVARRKRRRRRGTTRSPWPTAARRTRRRRRGLHTPRRCGGR